MRVSIEIRELRQNASRYLRLVEKRGEPIQITDRGRPVALLTPVPPTQSRLEQLRASGRVRPGKGRPVAEAGRLEAGRPTSLGDPRGDA